MCLLFELCVITENTVSHEDDHVGQSVFMWKKEKESAG